MSHRLDPQAVGASVTLAVRFDAAALVIIDRERQRLEDLTGESCDRSRALRSIVRRFGAHEGEVSPPTAAPARATRSKSSSSPRSKTSTAPTATSSRASTPRSKTSPSPGRWEPVAAADLRQLARDLAGLDPETFKRALEETGVARSALYAARSGKAGAPTFTALRSWLDARRG